MIAIPARFEQCFSLRRSLARPFLMSALALLTPADSSVALRIHSFIFTLLTGHPYNQDIDRRTATSLAIA